MLASSATSVRLSPTRRRPLARLMPTSSGAIACRRARRNSPSGEGVRTLSGTSVVMPHIMPAARAAFRRTDGPDAMRVRLRCGYLIVMDPVESPWR